VRVNKQRNENCIRTHESTSLRSKTIYETRTGLFGNKLLTLAGRVKWNLRTSVPAKVFLALIGPDPEGAVDEQVCQHGAVTYRDYLLGLVSVSRLEVIEALIVFGQILVPLLSKPCRTNRLLKIQDWENHLHSSESYSNQYVECTSNKWCLCLQRQH